MRDIYKVVIKESLSREICMKAYSKEDALKKAKYMYYNEMYMLMPEDLVTTEFIVREEDD